MIGYNVPKERLVDLILGDLGAAESACEHFHIQTNTSRRERLMSFTKPDLVAFIAGLGTDAEAALERLQSSFPLRRPPTLYLAIKSSLPLVERLREACRVLGEGERDGGDLFGPARPIRCVYLPRNPTTLIEGGEAPILELALRYERRVEITQADREAADYDEPIYVYSLETAFVWLPVDRYRHGVIACCDYPAVSAILRFLRWRLNVVLNLPRLDAGIFQRITRDALPRSATFSINTYDYADPDQVQHVTFADPALARKNPYVQAAGDRRREQTAGFFMNHPGLDLAGLGVASRDGKIWTPKRLDKTATLRLALTLIKETEEELEAVFDPHRQLHYYFEKVEIDGKKLDRETREVWLRLVEHVAQAATSATNETVVPVELVKDLVSCLQALRLEVAVEHECPTCGVSSLVLCPLCGEPIRVTANGEIAAGCATHTGETAFECECGEMIEFADVVAVLRMLPRPELVEAVTEGVRCLKADLPGSFYLAGTTLKTLPPVGVGEVTRLHLDDLRDWRAGGRIQFRNPGAARAEGLLEVLRRSKEKCMRDGAGPTKERCEQCLQTTLDERAVRKGEVCLLRLFGVPIGRGFDGIHHGAELADIKYDDVVEASGTVVHIGIHVKSRVARVSANGLGRSKDCIKGLYTQLIFSAYKVRTGGASLDVLGVAVPNKVSEEVLASMQMAANALGFPLLVIDEEDWLKVVDAAMEELAVAAP